jgi:dimethylamine corrinoid protein
VKKKESIMSWLKSMMEKEPPEPEHPIGVIVIGVIEGDPHKAPKEMVRKSLKGAGFKVVDIGYRVPSANFAKKAKEVNADIIAVSCSTTPGKNNLPKVMEAFEAEGLKGKVAIMTGGVGVEKDDADKLGMMYGSTREEAVALAKKAMQAK